MNKRIYLVVAICSLSLYHLFANTHYDPKTHISIITKPGAQIEEHKDYFEFSYLSFDEYGLNDAMNIFEVYYKIEGEDAVQILTANAQTGSLIDTWVFGWSVQNKQKVSLQGHTDKGTPGFRTTTTKFRWYLPTDVLGKKIELYFKYWWNMNDNDSWSEDDDCAACTYSAGYYTIPSIFMPAVSLERTSPGKIKLSWENANTNSVGYNRQGSLKITQIVGGKISKTEIFERAQSASSKTFVDIPNNAPVTYKIDFTYEQKSQSSKDGSINGTETLLYTQSQEVVCPALPIPDGLSLSYLLCGKGTGGSVPVSWRINNSLEGAFKFVLWRSTSSDMSDARNVCVVDYTAPTSDKIFYYEDVENLKIDQTYYYQLMSIPALWSETQRVSDLLSGKEVVSTRFDPAAATPLTVTKIESNTITISWERGDWCDDATLYMEYIDQNTKQLVTSSSLKASATSYQHKNVIACHNYEYTLKVKQKGKMTSSVPITAQVDAGLHFTSCEGSKGDYPQEVGFLWSVDNKKLVDKYEIYRRKANAFRDTNWTLITTLPGSESFSYRDKQADARVFYEYKIRASYTCGTSSTATYVDAHTNGFAFPKGTITGTINYAQGNTTVEGVRVAVKNANDQGKDNIHHSLLFIRDTAKSETGKVAKIKMQKTTFSLTNDFTWQAWLKPIAEDFKGSGKRYIFDESHVQIYISLPEYTLAVRFKSEGKVISLNIKHLIGQYAEYSIIKKADSLQIYINDSLYTQQNIGKVTEVTKGDSILYLGNDHLLAGHYFGYIDELRLWNKALSAEEVKQNTARYLSGSEENLIGFWNFDEGIFGRFFDMSRDVNDTRHANDAELRGALPTPNIPDYTQVSNVSYTDAKGYYKITGIPYHADGTSYKIVPIYGTHNFEPAEQMRYIGGSNSQVYDQVDFKDISSFRVGGTVTYFNTQYPVEGVSFLVDGSIVQRDGRVVTTDIEGKYEIDVPIGIHELTAQLDGHVFQANGLYKDNFIENNHNLTFIDSTLVKVVGRVVGGSKESAYSIGYGKSKNNIGQARIELKPELPLGSLLPVGMDKLERLDSTESKNVISEIVFERDKIQINCDERNGEYIAYLPPISYIPNQITFPNTNINSQISIPQEQRISYQPNPLMLMFSFKPDSTLKGPDSLFYQERQDYIYRNGLNFQVTQIADQPLVFGSEKALVENPFLIAKSGDSNIAIKDTLLLYKVYSADSVKYNFDYPIFQQYTSYYLTMRAFEHYENRDNGAIIIDDVPVVDGQIAIENNLAAGVGGKNAKIKIFLDNEGKAFYDFIAGAPLLASPYTKVLNVNLTTLGDGKVYNWREEGLQGIVLGRISQGSDFTTKGPNQVVSILRDPPGSGSSTSFTKGYIGTSVFSWGMKGNLSESAKLKVAVGKKTGTTMMTNNDIAPGPPGGGTPIGSDIMVKGEKDEKIATVGIGLNLFQNWDDSQIKVISLSSDETFSTSNNANYVGSAADVYIGFATNIISGISSTLDFELSDIQEPLPGRAESANGYYYELAVSQQRVFDDSLATMFVYPQTHIEQNLIPTLIEERNSYIITVADTVNFVNTGKDYAYISMEKPSNMLSFTNYKLVLPDTAKREKGAILVDKVAANNQDIQLWVNLMAHNETQKINARDRKTKLKNISFDAATNYSYGIDSVKELVDTKVFAFSLSINGDLTGNVNVATGGAKYVDFEINGGVAGGFSFLGSTVAGQENLVQTENHKKSFKYTLSDNNYYDYYSVAIDEHPDDGNSPVFIKLGGQSQCPYEDEERTKYQKNNEKISEKMIAIEVPTLSIAPATLVDIPVGKETTLELSLGNNSSVPSFSVFNFNLFDQATNPDGLEIFIDGIPLGITGLNYGVTSGGTVKKTIKVKQSRKDVLDYSLLFRYSSTCQSSVRDLWPNIEDSARLTLQYKPSCSELSLYLPNGSTVNSTSSIAALPVIIKDYDPNFIRFQGLLFESRKLGDQNWSVEKRFIKDTADKELYNPGQGDLVLDVSKASVNYNFDMSSNSDALYEIRASSMCSYKKSTIKVTSPVETIVKDIKRPQILGTPIPANGILTFDQDLGIQFSEEINSGLVYADNLYVESVMNESRIDHNVGIRFESPDNYAKTQVPVAITAHDFSVELWVKRELDRAGTVFSHGNAENGISFGFTADNKLWLRIREVEVLSKATFTDPEWQYLSFSYNSKTQTLNLFLMCENPAYANYAIQIHDIDPYSCQAPIYLGTQSDGSDSFHGIISELSLWEIARVDVDIATTKGTTLSRQNKGLLSYWKLDEGRGTLAKDRIRDRHLKVNAPWYIYPQGYALSLSGKDTYAKIPANPNLIRGMDDDYTIEFWMQSKEKKLATLLSCGKGDGTDAGAKNQKISIALDAEGELLLRTFGHSIPLNSQIKDSLWHHIAFSVRRGAKAEIFVDGELVYQTDASFVSGLGATDLVLGALDYAQLIGMNGDTPVYQSVVEEYFNGNIDEVRIWNSALSKEIIVLNMYNKLSGKQSDLLAYYPFETWYQDPIFSNFDIVPALHNQALQVKEGDTASLLNEARLSENYKALKDVLPKQAVYHEWVSSKDKIYIDIKEEMYKVEDCILEVTATKIQDVNGNELKNPIHLFILVDQSNLIWGTAQVETEMSFTTSIENKKGVFQNYKIEGIPSWMRIAQSGGGIAARQKLDIKVEIDANLGYGVYEGVLRLIGDDQLVEILPYKVHKKAPKPEWDLDDRGKESTMLFVGKIKMNELYSENTSDILAAFIEDTCVGMSTASYSSTHDSYFVYLTVYGRKADEDKKIQFKIWDAYKGIVYPQIEVWDGGLKQDSISFATDQIRGNVAKPYDFRTKAVRELPYHLQAGWNWISLPLIQEEGSTVATTFAPLQGNIQEVKSVRYFMRQDSLGWIGNLEVKGGLKNNEMYKVQVKAPMLYNFVGTPINLISEPILLSMNWNWLPYLPLEGLSLSEAFAGFEPTEGDIVKSQEAFATYTKSQSWIGSLTRMEVGKGYMYRAFKPKEFAYPVSNSFMQSLSRSAYSSNSESSMNDPKSILHWSVDIHKYPTNMNLIVALSKDSMDITTANTQIGAFVGDECRGTAIASFVPEINKYRVFLTVYGQKENELLHFKFFDEKEYNSSSQLNYSNDGIVGSLTSPFWVELGAASNMENMEKNIAIELYPNPVHNLLFLKSEQTILGFNLFALDGRILQSITLNAKEGKIDVQNLTSGMYILKLYTADGIETKRFVKK